jgi:lipooligosaccharide transport system permease protein
MQLMAMLVSRYTFAVVRRHYLVWLNLIWSSIASNVFNPVLFLFAFGFGLGAFIDTMSGVPYLAFIVPGMMAYAAMFAASFETTIGAYSRYAMQHTWDAMLASPVTLFELLWAEVLWASLKAMLSAVCVLIVGALWGGVESVSGAFIALPVMFVGSLTFSCCGLAATAYARGYDFFSYFFTFWITPMFVFCGVFFDIARFPETVQLLAWVLPMTHLIAVVRPLMTAQPLDLVWAVGHLAYVLALAVLAFWLAYKKMRQRLFD